jgi:hypothetical protein
LAVFTSFIFFVLNIEPYCDKIYADTNKNSGGTETMTASMRLR